MRLSSSPRSSPCADGGISMKEQIAGLMRQAQQMQENMRKLQDELASVEVEGQSGAGMVKVTMTCRHDVKRVNIDPSLLADDKEMLEDLVTAARSLSALRGRNAWGSGDDGADPGVSRPLFRAHGAAFAARRHRAPGDRSGRDAAAPGQRRGQGSHRCDQFHE